MPPLSTQQPSQASDSPNILRRHFLRGQFASKLNAPRPPWAQTEQLFTDLCSRCGDCIEVCETNILGKGDGGYPVVNFNHGECTFCQACVNHCQAQALSLTLPKPWTLRARIVDSCLTHHGVVCMSCRDQCPEQAIRMQARKGLPALPIIDNARCNGCGACYAPCPTQSILIEAGEA